MTVQSGVIPVLDIFPIKVSTGPKDMSDLAATPVPNVNQTWDHDVNPEIQKRKKYLESFVKKLDRPHINIKSLIHSATFSAMIKNSDLPQEKKEAIESFVSEALLGKNIAMSYKNWEQEKEPVIENSVGR